MTDPSSAPTPAATPADTERLAHGLDELLGRQLGRLRRRFLIHGVGWVLAALCGVTVLYYALDRLLDIPTAVRVLVSLGLLGYLLIGLRRRLIYPLQHAVSRVDVALAIERRFPELHQKLVSAWQLHHDLHRPGNDAGRGPRNMSPAMIRRLVAEAAAEVRALPVGDFLSPRRTLRVWGVAAVLTVSLTGVWVVQSEAFGVFLGRAVGRPLDYPRATTLQVLLQPDDDVQVSRPEPDVADVTLATGGDLPVRIRALGEIPRQVSLVLQGARGLGREVEAAPRRARPEIFAYTFRRVRGSFSFHARGGDDPHGDLLVRVHTVDPPLVGTVETALTYPAYTGREPETRSGGAIEALQGTAVDIAVTATRPVATATLHFLDSDRELALEPTAVTDDSGVARDFAGDFVVRQSDRYEIRLESPEGLRNPRPGSYPIVALEDLEPVGRLLLPEGGDVDVAVPGALIPVRLTAEDDYGLDRIELDFRLERLDAGVRRELLEVPTDAPAPRDATRTALLDTGELSAAGQAPAAGETIALTVALHDNRAPEPQRIELATRPVYVVDVVELQRRVASHFRRVREEVERSYDLQRDRAERLVALLEEPPDPAAGRSTELVSLEVGQGRILQSARRIHGALMEAYDVHLFNGLEGDESLSVPLVRELYLEVLGASDLPEPRVPEFYRAVARERAAGRIGPMEKVLDPILEMTLRADRIAGELAKPAVDELEAAGIADERAEIVERLARVGDLQQEILTELERLLGRLDEWNELQDVVQQARALRDAQRNVERETDALRHGGDEPAPRDRGTDRGRGR